MRGTPVAVLLLFLGLLAPTTLAGTAGLESPTQGGSTTAAFPGHTPHPPIHIDTDTEIRIAGQYNPVTGIVAGSGTAADPYIIEGWLFSGIPIDLPAIEIYRNHGGSAISDPGGTMGHYIVIRNNVFQDIPVGIRIHGSRHITIEDNVFTGIRLVAVHHEEDHFHYFTNDMHIRDNDIATAGFGIRLDQVGGNIVDYDVTSNTIRVGTGGVGIYVRNIHTGTVVFQDNDIQGGKVGIQAQLNKAGDILHNRIRDTSYAGVLIGGSAVHVQGNELLRNVVAFRLSKSLETTRIVDNHIAGNAIGLSGSLGDASGNWWGASDGPGGDGGGSGDPVQIQGTATSYSPWLSAPPVGAGPRI